MRLPRPMAQRYRIDRKASLPSSLPCATLTRLSAPKLIRRRGSHRPRRRRADPSRTARRSPAAEYPAASSSRPATGVRRPCCGTRVLLLSSGPSACRGRKRHGTSGRPKSPCTGRACPGPSGSTCTAPCRRRQRAPKRAAVRCGSTRIELSAASAVRGTLIATRATRRMVDALLVLREHRLVALLTIAAVPVRRSSMLQTRRRQSVSSL